MSEADRRGCFSLDSDDSDDTTMVVSLHAHEWELWHGLFERVVACAGAHSSVREEGKDCPIVETVGKTAALLASCACIEYVILDRRGRGRRRR